MLILVEYTRHRDSASFICMCILTRVIAASVQQTIHIISPEGMANNNNNNNHNKYDYGDNDNDNIAMHTK